MLEIDDAVENKLVNKNLRGTTFIGKRHSPANCHTTVQKLTTTKVSYYESKFF